MHNANLDADVIVVGLGPTGVTAASLMGQRGLRVLALDKSESLFPKPRAIGLDHEVMRVMQELGIADRILPVTAPYRPSEYRGVDGQVIRRIEAAPPPNRLGWASNYVFDQPGFETELRTRMAKIACITALYSVEVMQCGQDSDVVWIDTQSASGESRRFTARYLLACDGGSSPIRKSLGVSMTDLGFDEPWLVVDAIVSEARLKELPDTQVQYCEPARPCTYVVGPGNHRRWEIMLLPGDSLSAEFPDSELWPLLSRWLQPGEAKLWRAAAYRFRSLIADDWRRGRVLLCGDAAHMTPPFMSQGMVQGIRDALNISWKLQRVLDGSSPDALLDTYGFERRPHVEGTTRAAIGLGREICERDPHKARERDARLLSTRVNDKVVPTIRQNLIPGLQAGTLVSTTPGAGQLFPQPFVRTDGASAPRLLDDITGRRFRVILTKVPTDDVLRQLESAATRLDGSLHFINANNPAHLNGSLIEEHAIVNDWLSSLGCTIAVVRPDHYVYGTCSSGNDALLLLKQLYQQMIRPS